MFRASLCPSSGEHECALSHMVFCTGCDGCGCVELGCELCALWKVLFDSNPHIVLSALRTGRFYPQGHSVIGRITSMRNSNGTNWKRTGDLPICSRAPSPLRYCSPPFNNVLIANDAPSHLKHFLYHFVCNDAMREINLTFKQLIIVCANAREKRR